MELDSSHSAAWAFPLWELAPRDSWVRVGEGSFGNVYRASLLGTPVAVKEAASSKQNRLDGIKRDVAFLAAHPHPNIVALLGAWEAEGRLFVVMEFVTHSLRTRRVVNKVDLVAVLADVARALVRLHTAGHLHRDVKARNVLVTADYSQAKLADFGLARLLGQGEGGRPLTPRVGPRKYRAPEVESGLQYGTPADMYSFGVMARELLEQLHSRRVRRYGPSFDFLRALSRCCLREDPAARPSAMDALASLLQHRRTPLPSAALAGPAPKGRLALRLSDGGKGPPDPPRSKRRRSRSRGRSGSPERSGTSARVGRLAATVGGQLRDESDSGSTD